MRRLSETEILRIWEHGVAQHPIDRALTILAVAYKEESIERLAQLTIGERDARLLAVREKNFGAWLKGFAECPACRERLEFGFALDAIRTAAELDPNSREHELQTAEYVVRFRLPNSVDLAALVACAEKEPARRLLLERCLLSVRKNDAEVETPSTNLPESVTAALAAEMQVRDPQADVQLNLSCVSCGHAWQSPFDILMFLWAEIQAQAKRLLREVHALAWAYGWREVDILALSPLRRQMYINLAT